VQNNNDNVEIPRAIYPVIFVSSFTVDD